MVWGNRGKNIQKYRFHTQVPTNTWCKKAWKENSRCQKLMLKQDERRKHEEDELQQGGKGESEPRIDQNKT